MPDWLTALTVGEVLAFGTGLTAIWLGLKKMWPFLRRVTHFLDDLMGEPARAGVQARPGIMERLADHEAKMARIEHEVTPNHGGSLKDAVNRIEAQQAQDALRREAVRESVESVHFILSAHVKEAIRIEDDLRDAIIANGPARIERLEKEVARVLDDTR